MNKKTKMTDKQKAALRERLITAAVTLNSGFGLDSGDPEEPATDIAFALGAETWLKWAEVVTRLETGAEGPNYLNSYRLKNFINIDDAVAMVIEIRELIASNDAIKQTAA